MSHLYTEEQRQIGEAARKILASRYSGAGLKSLLEQTGRFDTGYWATCREMGWTAMTLPEAYGGLGLGLIELCIIAETAGRFACGAPFLITNFVAGEAVAASGDEALKQKILPALASGELIGTFAFAETPRLTAASGRVTGEVPAMLAGAFANFAAIQTVEGLAFVELAGPGIRRKLINGYDNSRGIADLVLEDTPARLLAGASVSSLLLRAAVVIAAEQLGGADACMESARDYANTRHAFGQPIGKFQAIKHKIAEMYVAGQIARANVLEAALRADRALPGFPAQAAAARISATEAYDFAAREATQIHGGIGVTWASDLHLHLRRARSLAGALGGRFVWEDRLVSALEATS